MRYLTKDQARTPKRAASPLDLPEFDAPLLVAKEPSASVGIRLRERQTPLTSEEGLCAMVADMVLNEDGTRMFAQEDVAGFLEGLSVTSAKTLFNRCAGVKTDDSGGAPVPSKPSTSAD